MNKKFNLTIDNRKLTATPGETVLDVALRAGIDIPHLCKHPDLGVQANCRMCVVAIDGRQDLCTACSTPALPGMKVLTDNPQIRRARKFNLELILAEHFEDCSECVWNSRCDLLKYRKKYNSKMLRFPDRKNNRDIFTSGPIIFDATKCIDCRNCIDVCPTGYYELSGRGKDQLVRPTSDVNHDCIYCGQCIVHCPAGAIKSAGEYDHNILELLKEKKKTVVVQFAPSIRVSIGEELGLPYGAVATDLLTAGLRRLGFKYVFDTSVGADFTTVEESAEALTRILSGKNLPIMTSCCPSWVRYVEVMAPEFIKNLSGARSPQIMLGGVVKSYWAKKYKKNPRDIIVVSIMPCTSKKFEVERKELKINGVKPVDYVLTTRELARLFLDKKIDLKKIKPEKADNPFGAPSGAGVIYGASGGVMESALRSVYYNLTGHNLARADFNEVRGADGIKRATVRLCKPIKIKGEKEECHELRVAVVNEIKNAKIILDELKQNPKKYHFVEVMACPFGCIGGGGQPLPVSAEIRQKRAAALYQIDKKSVNRFAHESPEVRKAYQEFFTDKSLIKRVLHTSFGRKPRTRIKLSKRKFDKK